MTSYWKERETAWGIGYYVTLRELMKEYYDWELDDMCDTFGKTRMSSGRWAITVRRTYVENDEYCFNGEWKPRNTIWTSAEAYASIDDLPEAKAKELYDRILTEAPSLTAIKAMFDDVMVEAEVERFIP